MPVDAAQQRRLGFYLKTDISVADGELQQLAVRNRSLAVQRSTELAAIAAQTMGWPAFDLSPWPEQGTFHLVHVGTSPDGRNIIVRSSLPELFSRDTSFLVDAWVLRRLPQHGLPEVSVWHVDCSQSAAPYAWMVMAPAPGTVMTAMSEAALEDAATFRALGAALRQVHQIQGAAGFGAIDPEQLAAKSQLNGMHPAWSDHALCRWPEHLELSIQAELLTEAEALTLQEYADQVRRDLQTAPPCLLHGDPGNSNFYFHDGKISAMLDWEDALLGDPLYDTAFWATFHPQRRWVGFWQGYGIVPQAGESSGRRFAFYFMRITLAKVLHRRRFGYADQPGRPTLRQRVAQALTLVQTAQNDKANSWLGAA